MNFVGRSLALCAAIVAATLAGPAPAQHPINDPLGVIKLAKGQPILIGYWLAVTGPAGAVGVDSRRGIELAIDAKGAVLGHPVQLVGEDSGCNPARAGAAATRLAANLAILAAIGPTCSGEAIAGAPILWKAGIASVSPSSTAPALTAANRASTFDGFLRTAHNDRVQGRVAAEFAFNMLKLRKAATLSDGSPTADSLDAVFAARFKELGGTIVAQEAFAADATDFAPVLSRVAAAAPDLVYYPVVNGGVALTRQLRDVAALSKVQLMSSDAAFSKSFLEAAGAAAGGMYDSSPDVTAEALGPKYGAFAVKYRSKFGSAPPAPYHAQAHDAAQMIFEAIEHVAKKDAEGNTIIGRKALRDALFATKGLEGLTGVLTCDQYGDCADAKIAVYRVDSVEPSDWAPGKNPRKVYP